MDKKIRISTCSIAAVLGFKEIIYTYLTLLGDSFCWKKKEKDRDICKIFEVVVSIFCFFETFLTKG